MKRYINKKSIIIASVVLLLLVAVDTTLAYIFTETGLIENIFNPSKVSCAVVENGEETEYTNNIVNTGDTKKNVQIKNTGDTDAYIRVAVVVNWASENGAKVWAQKPTDDYYNIKYDLDNGWVAGDDGFYYYSKAISPGGFTTSLIDEVALKDYVTDLVGTDGTRYYLSVEIIASAIQSTPKNVVQEQWGVTVDEHGTLTPNKVN